jgi:hypothetical protein
MAEKSEDIEKQLLAVEKEKYRLQDLLEKTVYVEQQRKYGALTELAHSIFCKRGNCAWNSEDRGTLCRDSWRKCIKNILESFALEPLELHCLLEDMRKIKEKHNLDSISILRSLVEKGWSC